MWGCGELQNVILKRWETSSRTSNVTSSFGQMDYVIGHWIRTYTFNNNRYWDSTLPKFCLFEISKSQLPEDSLACLHHTALASVHLVHLILWNRNRLVSDSSAPPHTTWPCLGHSLLILVSYFAGAKPEDNDCVRVPGLSAMSVITVF